MQQFEPRSGSRRTAGRPSRPSDPRVLPLDRIPCGLGLLLFGLAVSVGGGLLAPPAAAALTIQTPRLERVEYRRSGKEHRAVGEVHLDGERVRLHLFSETLANHYDVWIPLEDLIAAVPLTVDEDAAVREDRALHVAAREAEREAARKRREAEKVREAAREDRTRRSSLGTRRDDPKSESTTGGSRAEAVDGDGALPTTPRELARIHAAIIARHEAAVARASELLADIEERIPEARRTQRRLRDLAVAVEEAQLQLGKVARRLGARHDAIERLEADIDEGALRGRALREQVEYIGEHFERIDRQLGGAERSLGTTAKSFAAIPVEEPLPEPTEEPAPGSPSEGAPTAATARPASAPAPESSRSTESVRPAAARAAPEDSRSERAGSFAAPDGRTEQTDARRVSEDDASATSGDPAGGRGSSAVDDGADAGEQDAAEDDPRGTDARDEGNAGLPFRTVLIVVAAFSVGLLVRGSKRR